MCLLALPAAVTAQSMDMKMDMEMMHMPMHPTCAMLPANIMVSSDMSGVKCQQVSGAGIGVQSILNAGVAGAVDVWGMMDLTAEVCFEGEGSLVFLDATTSPRMQMPLESMAKDGMTCASIMHAGTVVQMGMMDKMDKMDKMDDMMMDSMDKMDDMMMDKMDSMDKMDDMMMDKMDSMDKMDDMMMDSMDKMGKMDDMMMDYAKMADDMDTMSELMGCELTARYNLNLRDEPAGNRIGRVEGGMMAAASARTENWFKIMQDDSEGWVSAHFVDMEGDCG